MPAGVLRPATLRPCYAPPSSSAFPLSRQAPAFLCAPQGLPDLMHENEDGVSLMMWLKAAHTQEWANFLERAQPQLCGLDPRWAGQGRAGPGRAGQGRAV